MDRFTLELLAAARLARPYLFAEASRNPTQDAGIRRKRQAAKDLARLDSAIAGAATASTSEGV